MDKTNTLLKKTRLNLLYNEKINRIREIVENNE